MKMQLQDIKKRMDKLQEDAVGSLHIMVVRTSDVKWLIAQLEKAYENFDSIVAITYSYLITPETAPCKKKFDEIRQIANEFLNEKETK